MRQQIQQFHNKIMPFIQDWKSIDLRVISNKFHDVWYFIAVNAILDHRTPAGPIQRNLPIIDNLKIVNKRLDISQLENLIESVSEGELDLGDHRVILKVWTGNAFHEITSPTLRFYNRAECLLKFGIDFASYVIEILQSYQFDDLETIDNKLRSYQVPWDGLVDLREHFIGFRKDRAIRTDTSNLFIIAPIYVRLKETTLNTTSIHVTIERAIIDLKPISVSVISRHSDDSVERISTVFESNEVYISLKEQPIRATVMISYNDIIVDSIELYGKTKNLRVEAFKQNYGDLDDFISEIKELGGQKLESRIHLLFHMLGFNTAHYGYGSGERIDILAFLNSNERALVIECTRQEPDLKNKLTKLATRSKEINQALIGIEILPVLVTMQRRSLINKTDNENASKENISLITYDEIPVLIQMAVNDDSPSDVYYYLSRMIPRVISFG